MTLVGPTGIWKPRGFELPLSITSVYDGPYPDTFQPDGLLVLPLPRHGPRPPGQRRAARGLQHPHAADLLPRPHGGPLPAGLARDRRR